MNINLNLFPDIAVTPCTEKDRKIKLLHSFQAYFFDQYKMTDGQPPNDRGCRACGKIGHLVRDCPKKKASDDHKKARKDNKNNAAKG